MMLNMSTMAVGTLSPHLPVPCQSGFKLTIPAPCKVGQVQHSRVRLV